MRRQFNSGTLLFFIFVCAYFLAWIQFILVFIPMQALDRRNSIRLVSVWNEETKNHTSNNELYTVHSYTVRLKIHWIAIIIMLFKRNNELDAEHIHSEFISLTNWFLVFFRSIVQKYKTSKSVHISVSVVSYSVCVAYDLLRNGRPWLVLHCADLCCYVYDVFIYLDVETATIIIIINKWWTSDRTRW